MQLPAAFPARLVPAFQEVAARRHDLPESPTPWLAAVRVAAEQGGGGGGSSDELADFADSLLDDVADVYVGLEEVDPFSTMPARALWRPASRWRRCRRWQARRRAARACSTPPCSCAALTATEQACCCASASAWCGWQMPITRCEVLVGGRARRAW